MIKHEAFHRGLKSTDEDLGAEYGVGQPLEQPVGEKAKHEKPAGVAKEGKSQVENLDQALRLFEILPLMSMLHEFIVTDLCHRNPKDMELW